MTRVLALVTFKVFPTEMGGQKGVVCFYKHLKTLLPVSLAVSRNNARAPEDWDVDRVLYGNKKMFQNPFVLFRLKKIVKEKGIDVIIAEHSYTAWMGWLLKKMTGLPFIIHSHNIEALRFRQMNRGWWRLYDRYEKWIHQKSDHNFFISADDQAYAITNYGLLPEKCSMITYGIEPSTATVDKKSWLQAYHLKGNETILYFNGTLDYKPNYDAVMVLLNTIAPALQRSLENFVIVISGNRATAKLIEQLKAAPNILFLGFVPDAAPLYAVSDVFINPVLNNSGVKTKVIEAIGTGCQVVSTKSGAGGIHPRLCGNNLWLADDNNWYHFTDLIRQVAQHQKAPVPKPFYDTYLWNNIAKKAAHIIEEVACKHANK